MKLTFTFTDSFDLATVPRDELYYSHFALPDSALQIPDIREQILKIAGLVDQLTQADLHITCKELDLKNSPIKPSTKKEYPFWALRHSWEYLAVYFEGYRSSNRYRNRKTSAVLRVRFPIVPPLHPSVYIHKSRKAKPLRRQLIYPSYTGRTEEQIMYLTTIQSLAGLTLALLNSEPPSETKTSWDYVGFYPNWKDNTLIDAFSKKVKRQETEARKREKLEQKLREREAQNVQSDTGGQEPPSIPVTGAGRRFGAVPGVFKGVQFRSQLEIRFVTQLEDKQIKWVYEGERLGEGNYLVDFYLPELKTWVEVKGKIEPRDDYFLKEISAYLKRERGERLFVYTSGNAFRVTAREFRKLTHKEFWLKLADDK